ncbi:MAG: Hsp20/alpha crystallin family protein [Balneolaceae bacterium]|nr:Hsp20/alpha crystallin family protein [Balneolaceae bacterium]
MLTKNFPTMPEDQNGNRPESFTDLMDQMFDKMSTMNRDRFVPKMDVAETDSTFEVTLALPGMDKEDINIEIENSVLTVSGERSWKEEEKENGRRYHRVETGRGKFSRALSLPNIVDSEHVDATFTNGELHITIPKLEEKTAKKIEIS